MTNIIPPVAMVLSASGWHEWMIHLYSTLLCIAVHLKHFITIWGGLSSKHHQCQTSYHNVWWLYKVLAVLSSFLFSFSMPQYSIFNSEITATMRFVKAVPFLTEKPLMTCFSHVLTCFSHPVCFRACEIHVAFSKGYFIIIVSIIQFYDELQQLYQNARELKSVVLYIIPPCQKETNRERN